MNNAIQRIGVCSWSLRPNGPSDLVEKIRSVGLSKVQLAMSPMVNDAGTWGDVVGELRNAGIEIVSGMFSPIGERYATLELIRKTGGVVPDETWEANLALATSIATLARRERINTVTFHAGFVPHDISDPNFAKLRDRLVTLARVFANGGCNLLLETGQETADDLNTFLDAVNQPNVGINFDPANMILYGKGDPILAIEKLVKRVRQVHIKDAIATKTPGQWGAEVPAGTGEVDWKRFFKVLKNADYTGHLIIEREGGDNRVADIVQARELVLQQLSDH